MQSKDRMCSMFSGMIVRDSSSFIEQTYEYYRFYKLGKYWRVEALEGFIWGIKIEDAPS